MLVARGLSNDEIGSELFVSRVPPSAFITRPAALSRCLAFVLSRSLSLRARSPNVTNA